jgi:hypothetical protein
VSLMTKKKFKDEMLRILEKHQEVEDPPPDLELTFSDWFEEFQSFVWEGNLG